ncbi:MAG: hypothetical protein IPO56_11690 [Flavobacteriales bacterium]|nr:hypothetical protein [Flavobacteriales bacterium]
MGGCSGPNQPFTNTYWGLSPPSSPFFRHASLPSGPGCSAGRCPVMTW